MAEDQGKEEEKFDFTGEGEAVGYISLAQARLLAMEHARDNTDFYGPSYVGFSLVWEVANTEETDEYYDVRLSFRPAGRFRGEPGLEQLIFDKIGNLRMRQLLDEPTELGDTVDSESLPTSATSPVVIPTTVASDEPSPVPELSMPNTAVNIARWRTQINRELEINREVVSSPGIAYTFQLEWGSVGRRDGQFNSPHGIAVDGAGEVYVTDIGNHRVQVFDANGQLLRKWGSEGRGDSQFRFPAGIAVDGAVSIYVADNHGERVQVFDANGRLLRKWWSEEGNNRPLGKRENFGNTPGQFNNPYGVAVDGAGAVYVVDTKNHRVLVFDNNGSFLADWGSEGRSTGQFRFPAGIAVDGAGNVYVADTGNRRVQVFDNNGGFLAEWGTEGSDDGQFKGPSGIAVDGAGRVYVVDTGNRRVQVFDDNGHFLANWGTEGNGVGQFKGPSGIAVDGAGNIYVVDTGNNRVQVFSQVR